VIVVDASAAVEALLNLPHAAAVRSRIFASGETLHGPYLLDVEVAHVVRRRTLTGVISARRGREAIEDLVALPLRRYPHLALLPRVWELRNNLTAYDATYVALAELLGAPLITRDGALASAAGHRARIELV
jgi:predicted nucleic acid-binding protein